MAVVDPKIYISYVLTRRGIEAQDAVVVAIVHDAEVIRLQVRTIPATIIVEIVTYSDERVAPDATAVA
jgi:hypothetical protein